LRERDPHQAQAAQPLDELIREALLAIEIRRQRGNLLTREVPHRVAQEPLLVTQLEVQGAGSLWRTQATGNKEEGRRPQPPKRPRLLLGTCTGILTGQPARCSPTAIRSRRNRSGIVPGRFAPLAARRR